MKLNWADYQQTLSTSKHTAGRICPQPHEISTDTRSLQPGQWFLPLSGKNFDGHTMIAEALAKGCRGYFSAHTVTAKKGVQVDSPEACYRRSALAWRNQSNALCIALTGSVGKTTTREMLACAFAGTQPVLQTEENHNNEIGVPKTLLKLTPKHTAAIIEIGARHPDDIGQLTPFVRPDIGLCLGATDAHLAIFGSHENLVRTKAQIFEHPATKTAIVPSGQPQLVKLAHQTQAQVITFGESEESDVQILEASPTDKNGLLVKLSVFGSAHSTELPVYHHAWAHNVAAVYAVAVAAKQPLDKVSEQLKSFKGVPGRFHITHAGSHTIIDDTYNASPSSMHAGLQTLHTWKRQPLTLILGDMAELGPDELNAHLQLSGDINTLKPSQLITIGPLSKQIVVENSIERIHLDRADDIDLNIATQYPLIYAKASNGIGLQKVLKNIHSHMKELLCSTT